MADEMIPARSHPSASPSANGEPVSDGAPLNGVPAGPLATPTARHGGIYSTLFDHHLLRMLMSILAAVGVWFALYRMDVDLKIIVSAAFIVFVVFSLFVSQLILPKPQTGTHSDAAEKSNAVPQPTDNTREIVETIVFVVVLVLLLKSFAAEAFVIPTGSMAETLWGYQKVVNCPKCEYQFPVNVSQWVDPQDGQHPEPVVGCVCPNCRQPIGFTVSSSASQTDQERHNRYLAEFNSKYEQSTEIPDPSWTSGDRVLVAKFLYQLCGNPERLEVVVFKYPDGPQKNHVPINYIKRLVGLPGEMIAIKGGKLYHLEENEVKKLGLTFNEFEGLSGEDKDQKELNLWRNSHVNDEKARTEFTAGGYKIIKKTPQALLSMRRIVFDNDHQAMSDLEKGIVSERWQPESKVWSAGGQRGFNLEAQDTDLHWLRYRHLLRNHKDPRLIDDMMGYNSNCPNVHPSDTKVLANKDVGDNWVGDLLLECEVVVDKAEGELVLELSRSVDRFQAVWDLTNGRCTLKRTTDGQKAAVDLDSTATKLGKGTYRVRFANVDRRLTVWVDNRVVEWSGGKAGVDYDPANGDLPTDNDLYPASIGARSAAVQVRKIQLWRDTYYTVDASSPDLGVGALSEKDWSHPGDWSGRKLPFKTLYVQPGHFLCLGDNSPQSSDGRTWGLVPERLLLGRAQLIYYPFKFPWWPLNSQVNRTGLIR